MALVANLEADRTQNIRRQVIASRLNFGGFDIIQSFNGCPEQLINISMPKTEELARKVSEV